MTTGPKIIGSNLKPGITPGGFSKKYGRSDGERNRHRHEPRSSDDVRNAADEFLRKRDIGQRPDSFTGRPHSAR